MEPEKPRVVEPPARTTNTERPGKTIVAGLEEIAEDENELIDSQSIYIRHRGAKNKYDGPNLNFSQEPEMLRSKRSNDSYQTTNSSAYKRNQHVS